MRGGLLSLSLAVSLAGCVVGPNYMRPPVVLPTAWQTPPAPADAIANLAWWDLLQDEELRKLVEIALAENKDVQIAVARIDEVRARLGIARSDLYPTIDLSGQAGQVRQPGPSGDAVSSDTFGASAALSWEIDFWGRIRRGSEAAGADLLAQEENRRAIILSLVSGVATSYFQLRQADLQLDTARRTLESRQETYRLASIRLESGLTSELDAKQFEAQMADAAQAVAQLERADRQIENALSVLLGRNPQNIPRGRSLTEQPVPPDIPAGLPSTLLERRPDILLAESELHAATARIGAAQAARLPSFSLTGLLGFQSTDLSALLNGSSRIDQLVGGVAQPVFNAGRLKKQVEVARAQAVQARVSYEKTILVALQEVEDGLVAVRTSRDEVAAARQQAEALRVAAHLARRRYASGLSSYLEVLDAERSLFSAELALARAQSLRLVSSVELFKALGGGWLPTPPSAP